ncbi:hypothetical protein AX16_010772 [Volvariella volvacea WC 439]|nr:hypothetical protein AX16_010772 [Volvariella volvacea WC 439]
MSLRRESMKVLVDIPLLAAKWLLYDVASPSDSERTGIMMERISTDEDAANILCDWSNRQPSPYYQDVSAIQNHLRTEPLNSTGDTFRYFACYVTKRTYDQKIISRIDSLALKLWDNRLPLLTLKGWLDENIDEYNPEYPYPWKLRPSSKSASLLLEAFGMTPTTEDNQVILVVDRSNVVDWVQKLQNLHDSIRAVKHTPNQRFANREEAIGYTKCANELTEAEIISIHRWPHFKS